MRSFGQPSSDDKKKILHFHTNGVMAAIFIAPLVELERKQGYESRVLTSIYPLKQLDGLVIPFDLNIRNLLGLPISFFRLCSYLYAYKPNVVISHNFKSSILPLLAARLLGTSTRIYFNHGVPYAGYKGVLRMILKKIEVLNMHLATEVVTVSKAMKDLLLQVNNKKTVSLIAHGSASGIELQKYSSKQYEPRSFYAMHGVSEGDVTFTYIGRPEMRKGFSAVLDLWAKFLFENTAYHLFLCGPSKKDVIKLIGEVPDRLHCLGFTQNVPEVLSNTKYLLLTSLHEGLPYSVLEAMASGCIVIANNIAGITNLIQHGVNGFLVDDNSLEEFAKAITFIQNQPQSFQNSIKQEAIKTASLYSRDVFLVAYKDFIGQRLDQ